LHLLLNFIMQYFNNKCAYTVYMVGYEVKSIKIFHESR